MNSELERRIRERAYEIWEREGRSGIPEDHWFDVERELAERDAANPGNAADLTGTAPQTPGAADNSGKAG